MYTYLAALEEDFFWVKSRKLLWGCLIGAVYFGILLLIGLAAGNTTLAGNSWIFSGGIVCAVAGMVGGMLAPVSEG